MDKDQIRTSKIDEDRTISERFRRLSARLPDVFRVALPYAPGASFCGAVVEPKSLGIRGHDTRQIGVAGRGLDDQQAFESCMGEACEYLSRLEWENDPLIVSAPENGLSQHALEWSLDGMGLSASVPLSELDWVKATSMLDEKEVAFPAELILRRIEAARIGSRFSESNGVAAGRTQSEATHSALMEVIERDAIALWWFGGQPAKRVSDTMLEHFGMKQFAEIVCRDDTRLWWLLDITSDIGVPTYAALASDLDGRRIVGGFCARLKTAEAMKGAFLEMCQMELAQEISLARQKTKGEENVSEGDSVWIKRSAVLNPADFPELLGEENDRASPAANVAKTILEVATVLGNLGYTPYWVDLTRKEIGVPVVRVIVPGLQSVKPDWISRRLREVAAKNSLSLADICDKPSLI